MPSQLDISPLTEAMIDPKTGKISARWLPWFSQLERLVRGTSESWITAKRPTVELFIGRSGFNTTLGGVESWNGSSWVFGSGLGGFLPLTGGTMTGEILGLATDENGLDVDPVGDADADLITVGVTGSPGIHWHETMDEFHFTHGINMSSGALTLDSGDITLASGDAILTTGTLHVLMGDIHTHSGKLVAGDNVDEDLNLIEVDALSQTPTFDWKDNGIDAFSFSHGVRVAMDASAVTAAVAPVLDATQGGIAAGSLEGWHEIGATSEPAFENSWVNFGGVYPTCAFRKLATGLVVIKGSAKSGTSASTIFTLPVGYRPGATHSIASIDGSNGLSRIWVTSAGAMQKPLGSNNQIELNMTYYAEG